MISITSARHAVGFGALWKTQPFHGSKRDLRLQGSKRDYPSKAPTFDCAGPVDPDRGDACRHQSRAWCKTSAMKLNEDGALPTSSLSVADRSPSSPAALWCFPVLLENALRAGDEVALGIASGQDG